MFSSIELLSSIIIVDRHVHGGPRKMKRWAEVKKQVGLAVTSRPPVPDDPGLFYWALSEDISWTSTTFCLMVKHKNGLQAGNHAGNEQAKRPTWTTTWSYIRRKHEVMWEGCNTGIQRQCRGINILGTRHRWKEQAINWGGEKRKKEAKWARKDLQSRKEAYKKHTIKFLTVLIDVDLYRLGRAHVSCSLRVISHHNLILIKLAQILTLGHFLLLTSNLRKTVNFTTNIYGASSCSSCTDAVATLSDATLSPWTVRVCCCLKSNLIIIKSVQSESFESELMFVPC